MHATSWEAVHLLAEPTRRRIYEAVHSAQAPSTRDEVAAAAGVSRRLAAFHLDLLAEAGLLEVDFARPAGRSGPGAGRPAKRYRATAQEIAVSLPERRYDLAARVLAAGVRDAGSAAGPQEAVRAAAEAEGRRIGVLRRPARTPTPGRALSAAAQALQDVGYAPAYDGKRRLRMTNCPFAGVVDVAPQLVCGMNESFVRGLLEGLGAPERVGAALGAPLPDCCVTVQVDD